MKLTNLNSPKLQFTPTAWAKLLFLRDFGSTEIGGFGICPHELLLVEDIVLPLQRCTCTTVEFDDDSVAGIFDDQVDNGLHPEQFARVWIHTHPGDCAQPSNTDIRTFARVFGKADWSVMFILACGGESYGRLRFNIGPGFDAGLTTEIDYSRPFFASDWEQWEDEYSECVQELEPFKQLNGTGKQGDTNGFAGGRSVFDDAYWDFFENQEHPFDEFNKST